MFYARLLLLAGIAAMMVSPAATKSIELRAGDVTYLVDPASLQIDARTTDAPLLSIMPPLHVPEDAVVTAEGPGWRWSDAEGHVFHLAVEAGALRLKISGAAGTSLWWHLPQAATGTWLIPDGEGMACAADDTFWRADYRHEKCLGGTTSLSFPAWSHLTGANAVTYALGGFEGAD